MKNIFTLIAMFIVAIATQVQTITTDSFYTFTHDTTISSFDALENNQCIKFGWTYGKTKYEIDEAKKLIKITYIENGVVQFDYLTIINIVVEGVAKQYYIHSENSGVNGDIIFTKDAEHKQDMVVSRHILDGRMVVNESYVSYNNP
jgi:hypothetical protein